jgi:hypothetical protein
VTKKLSFPQKRESKAFIKTWIPDQVGDDSKFVMPSPFFVMPSEARHLVLRPLGQKDALGVTRGKVLFGVTRGEVLFGVTEEKCHSG